MAEIYKDQTSPIATKIFWGGEIRDADDVVSAVVYDITEDLTVDPTVSPSEPIYEAEATKIETDNGTYQIILPLEFCKRNRKLRIEWFYEVDGNEGSHVYYTDVVTPYANLFDIIDDLGLGTDPGDPEYKTYHEIQMAEKYARKTIENYCNQVFYEYDDQQVVYGNGANIVPLPFRLTQIHEIYENDIKIIDAINNVNNWSYSPLIVESGFGIRVDQSSSYDNLVYVANGVVPPTVNDWGYGGAFKKDYRYRIQGRFGWPSIPDNVEEACILLIKDWFSKDIVWKNKYIKKIQTFDWQVEYTGDAYRGTGNYYADQLLNPYVLNGMVVI
jgi:hypothetical protein